MSTPPPPPPPPSSSSNTEDGSNKTVAASADADYCRSFVDKRQQCYRKHGLGDYHRDHDNENRTKYSKCWIPLLKAKRCLAFQHCAREAVEYYRSPSDKYVEGVNGPTDKGFCASFDEAYCFGNPRIMRIDLDAGGGSKRSQKTRQEIFDHHERWKRRVTNSKPKQGRCNDIRRRLLGCLQEHL